MFGRSREWRGWRAVPQQVRRLTVAFALVAVAFLTARRLFVPATFGERGHYRASAVDTILASEIRYAGHEACETCHAPVAEKKSQSYHRGVACEVCHGPQAAHVSAPLDNKPPAPRTRAYCPLCHGYNPSRPTGFPQIDPALHNPVRPCITCHDPHDPTPPRPPESCAACHGQIARTKAVSYHAQLPCTQCHEADPRHVVSPRQVRPTKPSTREFCGQCHAPGAASAPEIPRIDLETHNRGYVCWQCHYPHHPEAR
ncbi:MAG: multiheme c-type cytochrome [Gemmatimonadota bacterium]